MVIETPRLRLRDWRDDDVEPYAAMNADARVREFFARRLTAEESAASARSIRAHFVRHGFGLWAVEVMGGAPFVGFIGLSVPGFTAPFTPCVEVGWRLAVAAWGQGYATEGAEAALAFGFTQLGLTEIVAMTVPANMRSRRVMDRLGMRRDPADDFDHPALADGHPLRRHVLYRLTHEHWRERPLSAAETTDVRTRPIQV
jgi:ribosomal-protein-alanine N-acetyltransferase